MGVPNYSILVYDEQARALPQREHHGLYITPIINFVIRIDQAGKGKVVLLEVTVGCFYRVANDGHHLRSGRKEFLILLPQLAEVPAAERSTEAAQEYQSHALLFPVISQ